MNNTEKHANDLNVGLGNNKVNKIPAPQGEEPKIQRRLRPSEGIYVKGEINGVQLTFTADTGATRSIISPHIYNSIPKLHRPILRKSVSLSGVSGLPLKLYGCSDFQIKLGDLELTQELIVTEIEDEGLLGMDILFQGSSGPADILLSENIIRLHGVSIPCFEIGLPDSVRKVSIAERIIVPGNSELIIDAFIERKEDDDYLKDSVVLIEPTPNFEERYNLIMAATLADIQHNVSHKVRILNPFEESKVIVEDAVIGSAEKIGSIESVIPLGSKTGAQTPPESSTAIVTPSTDSSNDNPCCTVRRIQETIPEIPAHLTDLYTKACGNLSHTEQGSVRKMLHTHKDIFSKNDFDIGMTRLTEHAIDVGDHKPIKQPPRRVPVAFAEEEEKVIKQMENQGIIRPSTSPWASPIVLVRKKSGKVRPCVDYRRLNAITTKDAFPLPRVSDCLDSVAGATMFSCFDVTSGYHQIPVKESDIPKTAFCTKYGLYEYISMPMGLTNSPATFQRLMELALSGLQWHTCLIYLDDIVVFGSTFDEHLQRVEEVLNRIRTAGLKLKPEKCQLFQKEVDFLGHLVSAEGLRPNPHNIAKVEQWPTPTNVTDVRRILGLGNYYRRFVKNYSQLVRPLTDLTRKGISFVWTAACQHSFDALKQALIGSDVMAYPNDTGQYILDTDASDGQIAGILSQIQDGCERVISYGSRTLGRAEKNYCITDKELLAIRHFVEHYRQYLLGRTFVVRSDHQALVWLFKLKEPKGRIARWIELLSEYDFSIEYRPGTKHANADALSRCPNPWDCQCSEDDNLELQCGPCMKCKKRMVDMHFETVKVEIIEPNPNQNEIRDIIRMATTRSGLTTACETDGTEECSALNSGQSKIVDFNLAIGSVAEKQQSDDNLKFIFEALKKGSRPCHSEVVAMNPVIRHYWSIWGSLEMHDECLYKRFYQSNGLGSFLQLIVPDQLKGQILHQMHNNLLSGHLGEKKTRVKTQQRFYWYKMRDDIQQWVKTCLECQVNKKPQKLPRAPLGGMLVGAPMDRFSTDFLGPFPVTPRGNKYILVVTDSFTKWVEIFALPDQSAKRCVSVLLNEVIGRFGTPLSIHSDQGRNYESTYFPRVV